MYEITHGVAAGSEGEESPARPQRGLVLNLRASAHLLASARAMFLCIVPAQALTSHLEVSSLLMLTLCVAFIPVSQDFCLGLLFSGHLYLLRGEAGRG